MAAENVIERAVVSTDKLNVRKEPSQDSEIMGQVYKDERYPVESIQDGWVQIDDGDSFRGLCDRPLCPQ